MVYFFQIVLLNSHLSDCVFPLLQDKLLSHPFCIPTAEQLTFIHSNFLNPHLPLTSPNDSNSVHSWVYLVKGVYLGAISAETENTASLISEGSAEQVISVAEGLGETHPVVKELASVRVGFDVQGKVLRLEACPSMNRSTLTHTAIRAIRTMRVINGVEDRKTDIQKAILSMYEREL